jgi:hypothetical protein
MGKPNMDQADAVYHACGALPLLCELPGSGAGGFTADQMLDAGLMTIEEILRHAQCDGLRPYELWAKVRKQLFGEGK